ncbi:MAG: hypothetical protein Q8940_07220 [Bacteroidota bacterium]|nr:hypothetical protein [Bacteroidota bacterium]
MSDKPKCFIIMPITTPVENFETYQNDEDHFIHVMECLFIPAIEQAGFEPLSPIAEGSVNIHAGIIQKLETSDLVLCDMSLLNPNVMFEYGIRTALNKAVCVVVDDITDKTENIPFDVRTINYKTYNSSIAAYVIKKEIEKIKTHIEDTFKTLKDGNSLWRYFGIRNQAVPVEPLNGVEGKINYIMSQMDILHNKLDDQPKKSTLSENEELVLLNARNLLNKHQMERFEDIAEQYCKINNIKLINIVLAGSILLISIDVDYDAEGIKKCGEFETFFNQRIGRNMKVYVKPANGKMLSSQN